MGYIDPDDNDVVPVLVDAVDVEFAGKYSTRFALDTIKRLEQNAQNSVRSYNEVATTFPNSRVPSSPPFLRGLGSPLVVLDPVLGEPI